MYFDLPAALTALLHGSAAIDANVAHRVALQGTWLDSQWKLNTPWRSMSWYAPTYCHFNEI
jgi:hypothetical protein